ncbi:MAG: superoxide dismutase family protein [Weeksellaceae bacterium]
MKNLKMMALCVAFGLFAASCSSTRSLTYDIMPKEGTATGGSVSFVQKDGQVTMTVDATGLTPGLHAIHLHETADCSAADFTSTGGHWNPAGSDHGRWGEEHFHMGDIGNLNADSNGNAKLIFVTDHWCIGCSDSSKNILGKSVIIHEAEDDFHTQPTGNAGGRIGCIEIN